MNGRPRVLFFSSRFLFPLDTGGRIRTAKLLEALRAHWDVTLLGGFDAAADAPHRAEIESLVSRFVPVDVPGQPQLSGLALQRRRLRRLGTASPLSVQYVTSPELRSALAAALASGAYELFVCDFLQPAANVPWPSPCATLLFTHNVESRITRRQAELATGLASKLLWRWQHALMTRYEAHTARRFDRVVAVSDSDREEFEARFRLSNVRTIPTGVDTAFFQPFPDSAEAGHVVFCGSMDWLPNQDAIRWFVDHAWPEVLRRRPDARLSVVGRNPPGDLVASTSHAGVSFTGWVPDVRPWLARAACVVVPLRIGGGTRIKIYEAMAMERPVVSTAIGAEGLPVVPGRHFVAADTAEAFAEGVARCLEDPAAAARLAAEARSYVVSRFAWSAVADVFAAIGAEAVAARRERGTCASSS